MGQNPIGSPESAPKTLLQRETELRELLRTAEGRAAMEALADRYAADVGRMRPRGTSVVTYILVYERVRGVIRL